MVDLRSDTITLPSKEMKEAMMSAPLGDDVFGDDPSVRSLEDYACRLFGMEAALFCPSGTMTNQIGVRVHTQPGDEIICHQTAHVYNYEGGGMSANSGVSAWLLPGDRGVFSVDHIAEAYHNPEDPHYPLSRLVVIENTSNKGGGSIWPMDNILEIQQLCHKLGLSLHLDGARLFNALVERGEDPKDFGQIVVSVSICLSKGLGAPVGSLLLGEKAFIAKARRIRKMFGGGMRQAGIIAAAGEFALKNNIQRLKEDHRRAKSIEKELKVAGWVQNVLPVDTNIIIAEVPVDIIAERVVEKFQEQGILIVPFSKHTFRIVTHMDVDDDMISKTIDAIRKISF